MYLTPTPRHWILDIETDGLRDECTEIFVTCVENTITSEAYTFRTAEEFKEWDSSEKIYVGHNCIGFDAPVLNRLWGTRIGISRLVDTFLLSMLYSPSLSGGHSLDAWGQRLRFPKLEFKDFTAYSEEMLRYCQNDVRLTKILFQRLSKRMSETGFTEKGAELESLSWHIIQNKQRRRGFPLDIKRAHTLYAEIRQREEELKKEIYEYWPPVLQVVNEFKRARKANGEFSANYLRHSAQYPRIELAEDGGYSVSDWVEFNLGSPKQRVEKLLEAGWKPTSFTPTGSPKVDEDSLNKFAEVTDNDSVRALAKWVVANSRANMVRTWMNAYKEETGAIHGNLWLASTLRYRHDNPNSANIPAVRTTKEGIQYGEAGSWTYETRDLWTCGDRSLYNLVGVDAKGIQLRVLAHYLGDPEFTEAILSDDPHTANQQRLGLASRSLTKTITYATLMGAGDARIAAEADVDLGEAREAKRRFFEQIPGLPKLISRLQGELRRTGRITLCDGSRVQVSSDHMVIPYLLQGDESRIMKQAAIYQDLAVRKNKLDAVKVGDIHDEWQSVVSIPDTPVFIGLCRSSFEQAGRTFNYSLPIECDAKVGKTWAETH
jgi:DNA polymerase I